MFRRVSVVRKGLSGVGFVAEYWLNSQ